MSERTEYLRQRTLDRVTSGLSFPERSYLSLKAWTVPQEVSVIRRRGRWREYILSNSTPQIDEMELIVGKPSRRALSPEEADELGFLVKYTEPSAPHYIAQRAHMALDYEKILAVGISGIIDEIQKYRAKLCLYKPEDISKEQFYLACLDSLHGLAVYASNYEKAARKMAEQETNSTRKAELEQIADNLAVVPFYPARTFWQALQCIHFCTFVFSELYQFGHPDRYLYRYYRDDIEKGILTKEFALELITCTCLLFNDYIGRGAAVGLMVGGRDENGNDMTNELSYLFVESIGLTRMIYPGIGLCVNKDTPDSLLRLSCEMLGKGYSHPAFFNDDLIIKGLIGYGLPYSHACEYIHSTCVEITPCRRSGVWVASPYHNLVQYLLDIMSIPDIDEICLDYSTLIAMYRGRLRTRIREEIAWQNQLQEEREKTGGDPLVSCFVNDCLENGKDIDWGGATYNWIMPSFIGMSNLADSLMTLKKLVFELGEYSISEIFDILRNDWKGNEALRFRILNEIEKYGNDCDEPDSIVKSVTEWITEELPQYKTWRGDRFIPSLFCWIMHELYGRETMATPDGRAGGFPLGDGSGPVQGREKNGPTASVLSSTKWCHEKFIGGVAVNLKFGASCFNAGSVEKIMTLIKVFLRRGGFETQINVVDKSKLIDAKAHPERYADLVVRVGGYSDYFVNLPEKMQEEVIARTEHSI